jgi:hypothetical protein
LGLVVAKIAQTSGISKEKVPFAQENNVKRVRIRPFRFTFAHKGSQRENQFASSPTLPDFTFAQTGGWKENRFASSPTLPDLTFAQIGGWKENRFASSPTLPDPANGQPPFDDKPSTHQPEHFYSLTAKASTQGFRIVQAQIFS